MIDPYLVYGFRASQDPSWVLISAWATESLARAELERIKISVMSLAERDQALNPVGPWRFWEQRSHNGIGGAVGLPVTWLDSWSSNSISPRNSWSFLAVARLHVQGTVLDQIVEGVVGA